ncbi:MAG: hypothetical protein RIQ71_2656, partial [Verrucomicrobiota bacterium]
MKPPHATNGTGAAVVTNDRASGAATARQTTVLVALSDAEEADFLPPETKARLDAMPVRQIAVRCGGSDPGALIAKLREHRPDALVCAWAFPPLPEDLEIGAPGGLHYIAYLAGSVRKLVPRQLIERGLAVTNWGNTI